MDLGARYGRDEFAVVLTNADSESALKFANRIREAIDKLHLFLFDSPKYLKDNFYTHHANSKLVATLKPIFHQEHRVAKPRISDFFPARPVSSVDTTCQEN